MVGYEYERPRRVDDEVDEPTRTAEAPANDAAPAWEESQDTSEDWLSQADQGGQAPLGWDLPLEEDDVDLDLGMLEDLLDGVVETGGDLVDAAEDWATDVGIDFGAAGPALFDGGSLTPEEQAAVEAAVKTLVSAATAAGSSRGIPVAAAGLGLSAVLVAIAVFAAITLYSKRAGARWDGVTNPITGASYDSEEEFERVRKLSPKEIEEEKRRRTVHQANIHVQGDDMKKNVPNIGLSRSDPIKKEAGLGALELVRGDCTRSQLRDRNIAFNKAAKFIRETVYTAPAPLFRTFQNPEVETDSERSTRRVDIEIIRGTAFV